jgi:hypothetical protein
VPSLWLIIVADVQVVDFPRRDNESNHLDATVCTPAGGISSHAPQSIGGGVDSVNKFQNPQIVSCEHPERKIPEISEMLSAQVTSTELPLERPFETPRAGLEDIRHNETCENADRDIHELAAEVPENSPSICQSRFYPTLGLDSPMPSNKITMKSALETPSQGFLPSPSQTPACRSHLADRQYNPCGDRSSSKLCQLPDETFAEVSEPMSADDDSFEDMDMHSIRDHMFPILENIDIPKTNLKDSAMTNQSLRPTADYPPSGVQQETAASPRRASIFSATIDISDSMSGLSSDDVENFDDEHTNRLKRKHSIVSPEEYISSSPSTTEHLLETFSPGVPAESVTTHSSEGEEYEEDLGMRSPFLQPSSEPMSPSTTDHSLEAFSSDAPAESVTSHSPENEEYEEELGVQSPLLQPPSKPTSPSPTESAEDMDDTQSEYSDIWKAFPRITSRQRVQVKRTGDRLLFDDIATFLEQHSGNWKVSGFWNGPVWNIATSSKFSPGPDRAGLMTYLLDLQNDSDIYDFKLRIARVSLFLFFEREIICERQRGTANTALKRNAVSKLCNSKGLGSAEKRKLHKSFHNEKKIGEYWWWCVSFFGPSFLLRCSKEAGKKM